MNSRRNFLRASIGLAALTVPMTSAHAVHAGGAEPFQISLAQWSLHRALRSGDLTHLGFAAYTRREFDLAAVEYVSTFFERGATDFGYLADVRSAAADAGVASLLIMVDGEGALGAEDEKERLRAVERHFKWIAAACFLGCHSVRVNVAGSGDREEHSRRAAESLRRLCSIGDEYSVDVIVENHGGPSSDGAWLARTIARVDHPRCGTLPDFGNFRVGRTRLESGETTDEWYDRYRGVEELMPYAKAVSAKSHDFDADGNETGTDYTRMLRIVHAAGYRGFIGIEYEGERLAEVDGIRATLALLERVRETLPAD